MKRILLIDNYDSFIYNIPQVISQSIDIKYDVARNNEIVESHFSLDKYSHVIISPGPGNPTSPADFGGCNEIIEYYSGKVPILGVCLGHQGIAAHYGAKITQARDIMHGYTSEIRLTGDCPLFDGLHSNTVMRYHSLVVQLHTLPGCFQVTAVTDNEYEEVMAFNDLDRGIYGVQFHPESIGTKAGHKILSNFVNL